MISEFSRFAKIIITIGCCFLGLYSKAQTAEQSIKVGKLLYEDNFSNLDNWIVERPDAEDSKVLTEQGKLVIDVSTGATVWFKKKLQGDICIEYRRKVIVEGGKNDRLSDLNTFWMANDPRNKNLFTRSGVFSEYDSLLLYYVGFGGNTNSTTRFRKYKGTGERTLLAEYLDQEHLLQPNKEYLVRIIVRKGTTRFFIDGKEYFSLTDSDPINKGYFGFRTVQSRQEVSDFRVYKLR